MAHPLQPRLSPFLQLHPAAYEEQYRASRSFRTLATKHDIWTLYLTILTNVVFLMRAPPAQGNLCLGSSMHSWYLVFATLAVLQLAWVRLRPETYLPHRDTVLVLNRLLRTALLGTAALHFRTATATGCTLPCLPPYPAPSAAPSAWRTLFFASLTPLPLFHGLTHPLPFLPQLALHAAQFLALLAVHAPPARALLRTPACSAPLLEACTTIEAIVTRIQRFTVIAPPSAPKAPSVCHGHSVEVLLLFTALFFGVAVPTFVAYRIERRMKEHFLVALHIAQPLGVDLAHLTVIPVPHLLDLVMLPTLAVLCWVLVARFHQTLLQLGLP